MYTVTCNKQVMHIITCTKQVMHIITCTLAVKLAVMVLTLGLSVDIVN